MMKIVLIAVPAVVVALVAGINVWGAIVLGKHTPDNSATRDAAAVRVVVVFGSTGIVGDGLLEAAMQDSEVEKIYAVTRRMSPRLEAGQASGRVKVILQQDFTDYSNLTNELAEVNAVLWGLGTSSVGMDPELYRRIHVGFPVAFVTQWLATRNDAPMSFHYVTGMGTGENESAQWAQHKGQAERVMTELADGTGLRVYSHRSAWIRATDENVGLASRLLTLLFAPGYLAIKSTDLGRAMLEISARTDELANGSLIDNKDAIEYAAVYRENKGL